jgi:hypothetical protein
MTSNVVTRLEDLEDGTDVAVVLQGGTIEHWQWADGVMQKDGNRLPEFFFSGLLTEGKVMLGDFSPPVRGEWFTRRASEWQYLVVEVKEENTFRCAYFRRESFYEWRDVTQGDLLDHCIRGQTPEWATRQFVDMTYRCSEENVARLAADRLTRQTRDARANIVYARDYLNVALEAMNRGR